MLRTFCHRFASISFQAARLYSRSVNAAGYRNRIRQTLYLVIGGSGSTSLALAFFSKSETKQSSEKKNSEINIIREADALYNNYLVDNAYNILRKFRSSENPELLWRLARVLCEKGKQCKNTEEKKRLFNEALEIADRAKNGNEASCFGAHKWYAIILDCVAEQDGTKARIQRSRDVKVHLERALEINSLDATTWHILGVWHFTFADMSPYVYMIAKTIYATPPVSTYDEALRHFEKAETISPGFYSTNTYYLALVKERLKKKDEALQLFKDAFYAPVITVDDRATHEKVADHLRKKYGLTQEKLVQQSPN